MKGEAAGGTKVWAPAASAGVTKARAEPRRRREFIVCAELEAALDEDGDFIYGELEGCGREKHRAAAWRASLRTEARERRHRGGEDTFLVPG